jgi:predicted ArsR family transcriptional regulator
VTTGSKQEEDEVYRFIFENIDSVPHLEALLLLWNTRPANWSPENLAKRLYIDRNSARDLLQDLSREELIAPAAETTEQFYYKTKSPEMDRLIATVDETYRTQLVRVSTLIHSKASSAVRDFARAFRFTKKRD